MTKTAPERDSIRSTGRTVPLALRSKSGALGKLGITRSAALLVLIAVMAAAAFTTSSASSGGRILGPHPAGVATTKTRGTNAAVALKEQPRNAVTPHGESTISQLKIARKGHTATALPDGRVIIVGGENPGGQVRESEIYDPATRQFSLSAKLHTPRADHSAAVLPDGRILVIGGHNVNGSLRSTEILDPATGSFSRGPSLTRARSGHTATALRDGKILVTGGDSRGTAEILDPDTMKFTSLQARMALPRSSHSAILLKSGKVLIAGGVSRDGGEVRSGEIFDPETLQFTATTNKMLAARTRPTLRELPDGKVQVIGGDDERSMEMFNAEGRYFTARARLVPDSDSETSIAQVLRAPSRAALIHNQSSLAHSPEGDASGLRTRQLLLLEHLLSRSEALADLFDRSEHTITEIPLTGTALIAGGTSSSGMTLMSAESTSSSSATVTTDKTDYAPGETVIIHGANWEPGETVQLTLHRDDGSADTILSSAADVNGGFTNDQYLVQETDLGVTFVLTAVGQSSGFTAQTTFTDAVNIKVLGADGANHPNSSSEENLGTFVQGTNINLTCPRPPGTGLEVSAGGLGGSTSQSWTIAFGGGGTDNATLSPVTSLVPASGTVVGSSDSDCVAMTVATGTLSPGIYHASLQASGPAASAGNYFFSFSVTAACTAPTISACPGNITANTSDDGTGNCSTTVSYTPPTVTGGTEPVILACTPPSGSLFEIGTTTVTCQATNDCGSASCTFTVTVLDDEAPVISNCPTDLTVYTGTGATTCSAIASWTAPTASDNCTVTSFTSNHSSGDTFFLGTTTVTYTAKDAANNEVSCSFKVTVIDNTPPVISGCPTDLTVRTGPGATTCAAMASWTDPTATDNCSGAVNVSCEPPSGSPFEKGTTTVTCTASDASPDSADVTCTFNVTVVDNTPPVINNCPTNQTVFTGLGATTCSATASWTNPTATDNCPGAVSVTCYPASGSSFNKGTTTVTCTAKDASPDSDDATCSFTVTVVDNTLPTISCPANITAAAATGCSATVNVGTATALDNCPGVTFAGYRSDGLLLTDPYPGPSGAGSKDTTIVWKATDGSGNVATCSQTVTVTNDAPQISSVTGPTDPVAKGSSASVTVSFTDTGTQGHDVKISWDDGSGDTTQSVAAGGTSATISHMYAAAGVYTLTVMVTDDCGASVTTTYQFIVVYDPDAGFVTGGGWIMSPQNAYLYDSSLTGKASFGFVSKYKKGQSTPTGETQFQFQAGNLNFHSSVYEWLVVSGSKAQYKGSGTINGEGDYGFLLTAVDGQLTGGGGIDKFRIKIWDKTSGQVIYDNKRGISDDIDSADPQAIGGGSIVIHK